MVCFDFLPLSFSPFDFGFSDQIRVSQCAHEGTFLYESETIELVCETCFSIKFVFNNLKPLFFRQLTDNFLNTAKLVFAKKTTFWVVKIEKIIANKIRTYRHWYGLSKAELVEKAGLKASLENYGVFEKNADASALAVGDLERVIRYSCLPPIFFLFDFSYSRLAIGTPLENVVDFMRKFWGNELGGYDKVLLGCKEMQLDRRLILNDIWYCMLPVQMNAFELYEQVKDKIPEKHDSQCHQYRTYDLRKRGREYFHGERIRIARRMKGLSQREFSLSLGEKEDFVKKFEDSGKRIRKSMRLTISEKAGLPRWWLVGNKEFEKRYCRIEDSFQKYLSDASINNPLREMLPHSDFMDSGEKRTLIILYNFLKKYS